MRKIAFITIVFMVAGAFAGCSDKQSHTAKSETKAIEAGEAVYEEEIPDKEGTGKKAKTFEPVDIAKDNIEDNTDSEDAFIDYINGKTNAVIGSDFYNDLSSIGVYYTADYSAVPFTESVSKLSFKELSNLVYETRKETENELKAVYTIATTHTGLKVLIIKYTGLALDVPSPDDGSFVYFVFAKKIDSTDNELRLMYAVDSWSRKSIWLHEGVLFEGIGSSGADDNESWQVCINEDGYAEKSMALNLSELPEIDNFIEIDTLLRNTESDNSNKDDKSGNAVSQKELDSFTKFFDKNLNGFLVQDFDDVRNADLNEVFYNGIGDLGNPTQDEVKAYLKAIGETETYTDVLRLYTSDIDEYLRFFTGYSYSDMKNKLPWTYVEQYDAYFLQRGDTNYMPYMCVDGKVINVDGDVKTYELKFVVNTGKAYKEGTPYKKVIYKKGEMLTQIVSVESVK